MATPPDLARRRNQPATRPRSRIQALARLLRRFRYAPLPRGQERTSGRPVRPCVAKVRPCPRPLCARPRPPHPRQEHLAPGMGSRECRRTDCPEAHRPARRDCLGGRERGPSVQLRFAFEFAVDPRHLQQVTLPCVAATISLIPLYPTALRPLAPSFHNLAVSLLSDSSSPALSDAGAQLFVSLYLLAPKGKEGLREAWRTGVEALIGSVDQLATHIVNGIFAEGALARSRFHSSVACSH